MKLANKVALITGGTSGIGLEAAKLFAAEGARVVVAGVDQRRLDAAAHDIGGEVMALRADLRTPSDLDLLFDQIKRRYGRLDVLFANAGLGVAARLIGQGRYFGNDIAKSEAERTARRHFLLEVPHDRRVY